MAVVVAALPIVCEADELLADVLGRAVGDVVAATTSPRGWCAHAVDARILTFGVVVAVRAVRLNADRLDAD